MNAFKRERERLHSLVCLKDEKFMYIRCHHCNALHQCPTIVYQGRSCSFRNYCASFRWCESSAQVLEFILLTAICITWFKWWGLNRSCTIPRRRLQDPLLNWSFDSRILFLGRKMERHTCMRYLPFHCCFTPQGLIWWITNVMRPQDDDAEPENLNVSLSQQYCFWHSVSPF